jgi:hypothetical protein
VEFTTLDGVEWFNHRRLLDPIGNILPVAYKAFYHPQQETLAVAAGLDSPGLPKTRGSSEGCGQWVR